MIARLARKYRNLFKKLWIKNRRFAAMSSLLLTQVIDFLSKTNTEVLTIWLPGIFLEHELD